MRNHLSEIMYVTSDIACQNLLIFNVKCLKHLVLESLTQMINIWQDNIEVKIQIIIGDCIISRELRDGNHILLHIIYVMECFREAAPSSFRKYFFILNLSSCKAYNTELFGDLIVDLISPFIDFVPEFQNQIKPKIIVQKLYFRIPRCSKKNLYSE